MNDSSTTATDTASGAATSRLKEQEEISGLKVLHDILHNRIIQKKGEIHESHSIVYNQNLWREIETLHLVLAQILALQRIYDSKSRRNIDL